MIRAPIETATAVYGKITRSVILSYYVTNDLDLSYTNPKNVRPILLVANIAQPEATDSFVLQEIVCIKLCYMLPITNMHVTIAQ